MLKVNKSISLSGTSNIEEQVVVYMSATISTDGNNNVNITKSIQNHELYNLNKEAVRADMKAFEDEVYKTEDSLVNQDVVKGGKR